MTPPTTQGGNWIPKILHLFLGAAQGDGKGVAYGKLALDASGNLYGATQSGGLADTTTAGTVFELSPPTVVGGNWKETVLYKFQSTGKNAFYRPRIGVALGLHGELYGLAGAPRSSVFYQLKPPVRHGGTWTTSVINSQGAGGSSDLLVDSLEPDESSVGGPNGWSPSLPPKNVCKTVKVQDPPWVDGGVSL